MSAAVTVLASIPSPASGQLHIGPFRLTAYGLMIAIGVLAAVEIARRRHAARGGNPDDISAVAVWAVIAGLLGARVYHVLTDLDRFKGHWSDVVKVWEGGLGIPGGLIAGIGVGALLARRRGIAMSDALDVAAPALPVAQAIGRWGNWWNQELYGRPTDLPWGLRIDPAHRIPPYEDVATFHPTFLYELLWNLALAGGLIWIERRYRGRLRPGSLFALYVAGYGVGRLWVEALRVDPAQKIAGIRFNLLLSLIAIVAGLGYVAIWGWRPPAPSDVEAAGTGAAPSAGDGIDLVDLDADVASGPSASPSGLSGGQRSGSDEHGDAEGPSVQATLFPRDR